MFVDWQEGFLGHCEGLSRHDSDEVGMCWMMMLKNVNDGEERLGQTETSPNIASAFCQATGYCQPELQGSARAVNTPFRMLFAQPKANKN